MEDIFLKSAVVEMLSSLPKRSTTQQLLKWRTQKEQRRRILSLLCSLGKRITAPQAKRLDVLDLPYEALCAIRSSCTSDTDFQTTLLQRGVRSRPLREKLTALVPKS